ncbi:MAG: flagellar biosynthesis protein FlgJ [Micavibrio sp.]|nr:flagellar biosynthesis protein FlgJ [Micavibrio sp.]|tara:strand:+ start:264 stop:725 length:462 start_codon:yes stop_codon:yes gene_type:complete
MDSTLTSDTTLSLLQTSQGDGSNSAKSLKNAASRFDLEKSTEAAKEFEAVFIAEMMKPMFEGISTDGPFGGGKGEEVFRSLLLQEYGKMISQTGSIGLSDEVRSAMIDMQAQASSSRAASTIEGTNTEQDILASEPALDVESPSVSAQENENL